MVRKGRIIGFFILVLIIGGIIGYFSPGIKDDMKLGLDLQGGFEVLYEVHPAEKGQVIDQNLLVSTVSALYNRVDVIGVNEPNIQIEGEDRIRVQLAGVENQEKARELLSTQAKLSFRDVNGKELLDGTDLKEGGAGQSFNPDTGQPIVTLKLKSADIFGDATTHVLGMAPNNQLVIWMDYEEGDSFQEEMQKDPEKRKIISAPNVNQVLNTTDVIIEGNFTVEEAKELSELLNAGSLPVDLEEMYSTSVGAKFGEQALQKTVYAGFIGIAIIFIYMIFYYRFPGVIAVITLSTYIYLILQIFDWMNGVLTLPGIAAIILGVGMAVDANIITYERIGEEIKSGKSIQSAFRAGNRNSLSTILDANITTILAATVLFIYGTSSVKGFATMLIISILSSFITAVYGTRLFLGLWVNSNALNGKTGWFGVKSSEIEDLGSIKKGDIPLYGSRFKNLDLIKHRKRFFMISGGMVVVGIILLSTIGLNLGIDFESGTRVDIMSDQAISEEKISKEFAEIDYEPTEIGIAGNNNEIGYARFSRELEKEEVAEVKNHFKSIYGSEPNVSTVSPTVGKELARNAFISVMIASIGMIIYVTLRFEIYFALAAIVALLHDAFFIIALFSLLQFEVNVTFIAAVLTIVGYSINDTIVTFDRIRENLKLKEKIKTFEDLANVVNKSLIQTLGRSINTVLTVVIAAAALAILGGEAIRTFAFALLFGLAAGTYSSIFLASQLWLVWKKNTIGKEKKKVEVDPDADLKESRPVK